MNKEALTQGERTWMEQGEVTIFDKPHNGTSVCIRCSKPARQWNGHVICNKKKRAAGWCSYRCQRVRGFFGRFTEEVQEVKK